MSNLFEVFPRRKHIRDDGWLVEMASIGYPDEPRTCHSYMVSFKPRTKRAGHYHLDKEETFCAAYGKIMLTLEDIKTKERETLVMDSESSDYYLVHVKPPVAHIFENISEREPAVLIVFTQKTEDPQDTYKYDF